MARVGIDLTGVTFQMMRGGTRGFVIAPSGAWYTFTTHGSTRDLIYNKSTDEGATWGAGVVWGGLGSVESTAWDVFYEGWIPGGRTNIVHLLRIRDAGGTSGPRYRQLDLNTDTLSTEVTVATTTGNPAAWCSIVASSDHTLLYCTWSGNTTGAAKSTTDGASWVSAANILTAAFDAAVCWPDYSSADPQDIMAAYYQSSDKRVKVKQLDVSANTVTTTNLSGSGSPLTTSYAGYYAQSSNFTTALDVDTGKVYLAVWNVSGSGSNELKVWEIYGNTSTQRTSAITATTYCAGCALSWQNGTLMLFYGRDPAGASFTALQLYYKTSANFGVTWGTETEYDTTGVYQQGLSAPPVVADGDAFGCDWFVAGSYYYIVGAAVVVTVDARLQLSDGADPDVATLDITADAIGPTIIKVERGRESAVLGMPSRAGQATTRLNNQGLGYGMDEPVPGLALRLNKKYSGTWYHLWHGNLDIPQHTMTDWRPVVDIRALGPLTKLAQRKVSTPLYKNVTTGAAIGYLLDAAGFPATARDLDAGDVTLAYWWCNDEDALTALWKIVDSEGITAELYESGAGELVFRSRTARYTESRSTSIQTTFRSYGANPLFNTFEYTAGYREIINAASHDRYRRTDDSAPSVVWEDVPDFYYIVPPNDFIEVLATAQEPFFDAITPAAGTDFSYGFDAPTVTLERTSGQRTKIRFTSGSSGTTLTALQLRATKTINNATYAEVNTVDASASITAYGLRPWGGSMSKELDFATMRDNLDGIVNWKQTPRGRVRFSINAAQSAEANAATAQREIGDRVRVIESELGFDGECWIERIEHEVHAPAGPADGSAVGSEVTTFECSVISVASGSTGTGLGENAPYTDNSVYVGTSLDDDGITMRGASIF